jgi:beta-xylosidase
METKTESNTWQPDLGDGIFQNPIIHADYSDPDVIRVGDDFFMVSSSFSHMPGLPILHSKDLVNWKIVNHVIERLELPGYDKPQHGKGVWAPSIRYHNNKFWVYFSTPDEGIFMSTTKDPFGRWEPLHRLKEVKGWIDPCPFWDDDGQAYLVNAFAYSRCGRKHILNLSKMSADGKNLLDDGQIIYDGTLKHPTLEGPKFYKRNGYYYIFAPAGGVETGWQTILRSKSVFGPYEDKIVLHQGDTEINGPHQGGWVELDSGESWFVHFQDKGVYGRIVHLQPVKWVDDWPLMGQRIDSDGKGEPVKLWKKPDIGKSCLIENPQTSDEFESDQLGLQWQWQANPNSQWYSLSESHLRLFAHSIPDEGTLYEAPHLLMQKFPAELFTATSKITYDSLSANDRTGLIIFGESYSYISIEKNEQENFVLSQYVGEWKDDRRVEKKIIQTEVPVASLYLRVRVQNYGVCIFSYSINGLDFYIFGDEFIANEGKWVGAKVGIFAAHLTQGTSEGYTDFDWFRIDS